MSEMPAILFRYWTGNEVENIQIVLPGRTAGGEWENWRDGSVVSGGQIGGVLQWQSFDLTLHWRSVYFIYLWVGAGENDQLESRLGPQIVWLSNSTGTHIWRLVVVLQSGRGNSLAIPFDLCRLVGRPWRHSRLMACIFVLDNQPKGVCCVTHPSLFPLGFRRKMKLQSNENLSPGAAKRVSFSDDGAGIIMRMGLFVKTQCISDGSPLKWKCPSQWVRERQNIGVFQRSRLLRQPICLLLVSND